MAKYKTKGLILKFGATATPTEVVAQLGDCTLDLGAREGALDVTTHDNTDGNAEMLDNGFKSPWSFSGEIVWDPANTQHELLRSAHGSGTTHYATVVVPDAGAAQITGPVRVSEFSAPTPVKGSLRVSFTLEGMSAGAYTQ